MEGEKLVDTLYKPTKVESQETYRHTDSHAKRGRVGTHGFTLLKKQAKALASTLANRQREVDLEKLRNRLIKV